MRVARLRLPAVVEVMWTLALGREAAVAKAAVYLHHTCLFKCRCGTQLCAAGLQQEHQQCTFSSTQVCI